MRRYEDFWWVTRRALKFACRSLGVEYAERDIERLMERYLELDAYPDVQEALQSLSDRTLVILSNGAPSMLASAVGSAGVGDALSHVISADRVRSYKPDPTVYRLATDALKLEPASIAFVSSNSFDVMGAKSFGFWTCWVNRQGAGLDELGITPDLEVSSLRELAVSLGG